MMKAVLKKLLSVQTELKAPKNQFNTFGKYNYRSAEDILEAVKPLLDKHKVALVIKDKIEVLGDRFYIQATATLYDTETGESIEATALAREPIVKKGMDDSQITGATSSYARKYALNGLFAIDDNKDGDTTNQHGNGDVKQSSVPIPLKTNDKQNELISRIAILCSEKNLSPEWLDKKIENDFGKGQLKDLTITELTRVASGLERYKQEA